jgi:hypothetical protein
MERARHLSAKSLILFSLGMTGLFPAASGASGQRTAKGDQQRDNAKDHSDDS